MSYVVSRQIYWPDGEHVVEVAVGGLDYAGADCIEIVGIYDDPREAVEDTYRRVRNSEYKRRQATPCIKITPKAFGIGWKMPITNKYNG